MLLLGLLPVFHSFFNTLTNSLSTLRRNILNARFGLPLLDKEEEEDYPPEPKWKRVQGMLWMLLAVLFYHGTRLFVKLSFVESPEMTVWEGVAVRSFFMSVFFALTILLKDPSLFKIPR